MIRFKRYSQAERVDNNFHPCAICKRKGNCRPCTDGYFVEVNRKPPTKRMGKYESLLMALLKIARLKHTDAGPELYMVNYPGSNGLPPAQHKALIALKESHDKRSAGLQ